MRKVISLVRTLHSKQLDEIVAHNYDYAEIKLTDIQGETFKDL